MNFNIQGDNLPVVVMELSRGESVFSESGGLAWMSDGIAMDTNMEGGILGGLSRAISGESLFLVTYTAQDDSERVAFASSMPGEILPFQLEAGEELICQKSAFLVAEKEAELNIFLNRKLGAGLFGGEGFILQKVTGPGTAFLEIDGAVVEHQLESGENMRVDPGYVAAFETSVDFSLNRVKGFKNIFFGGEGLFLAELRGPGKVWLQTMPLSNLARQMLPFLPSDGND